MKSAITKANELAKISDLRGFSNKESGFLYEQNGIKYDDRVSVFSDDQSEIDNDVRMNFLDLWLGDAEFDEVSNLKSLKIFFYFFLQIYIFFIYLFIFFH